MVKRSPSAAARSSATAWARASVRQPKSPMWSSPMSSFWIIGVSSKQMSASRTAALPALAKPAIRTSSRMSSIIIGPGTDVIAGEGKILDAGRHRHAHPFHRAAAGRGGLAIGTTTLVGGGTGPTVGTLATTVTPGPWDIHRMLEAVEDLPDQCRLARQRQCQRARTAAGTDPRRGHWAEAPRRLGHDTGCDRQLPDGRGRGRHPGCDPHRHAE